MTAPLQIGPRGARTARTTARTRAGVRYLAGAVLMSLLVLQGCARAEGQTFRERLAERRGTAPAEATGLTLMQVTHQGMERSYYVHVPAGLAGQTGLPAVMMFHGGEGNGLDAERLTGLSQAADAAGFVAIFPNAPGQQWNDGRATTRSGIDDVAFARALIDTVAQRHGVSPGRVFAAGASNGGMFVQRLACEATGSFRAYAVAAANMPRDLAPGCAPQGAPAMLFFTGVADRLMPYEGGEIAAMRMLGVGVGGAVLSAAETRAFWTRAAGCASEGAAQAVPDRANDGTTVSLRTATGCAGGVTQEFYTIEGGGHTWPGTALRGSRLAGVASQDISATGQTVAFFRRYGL